MSLISLLIALAAERSLSSPAWQFNTYFQRYISLIKTTGLIDKVTRNGLYSAAFVLVPVLLSVWVLSIFDNALLHLILSTLLLIICFGCFKTRDAYKQYLMSAFRGELSSCSLHHQVLEQDKSLSNLPFGHILIWLNYRYFIAIMLFFVLFGAPGALFYRLLTTVVENGVVDKSKSAELECSPPENNVDNTEELNTEDSTDEASINNTADESSIFSKALAVIDWLPVRLVAFGYMLVGHFSKALPIWLENLGDFSKTPYQVLIAVAEKSEDVMIADDADCTAEPCLLVRLAKRTSLLCLTVLALLILTGVIE